MRKPRDYDTELKQLDDKAKQLRSRKVQQFGELLIATRADRLPVECLAGALLAAAEMADAATKEAWRKRGAAFFHARARTSGRDAPPDSGAASADRGVPQSSPSNDRA